MKIVCQPAPPPGEEWEVGADEAVASPLFAVTPHASHKLEENIAFSPFAPAIPRSPNQMQTNLRTEKYLKAKEGSITSQSLSQSRLTLSSSTLSPLPAKRQTPVLRHLRPNYLRSSLPPIRHNPKPLPGSMPVHWDENLASGPLSVVLPFCSFPCILKLRQVNKKLLKSRDLKHRLRDSLIAGIGQELRVRYWNQVTKSVRGRDSADRYFGSQRFCSQEIKNDIFRTPSLVPGQPLPKQHQEAMMRVLHAVELFNSDVGYCQGMNYIAGVLIHLLDNEKDIFWLMNTILVKFRLKNLLLPGLVELKLKCFQLDCFMQHYLPAVAEKMKELGISTEVYAAKWFITLLSYELPFGLLVKVWDFFFVSGWKVVFRVILALLSLAKEDLVSADSGTITGVLNSMARRGMSDESLLKVAFNFKVTKRLLRDLKLLKDRKAKGRYQLLPGKNRKLEWIVTPYPAPVLYSPTTDASEDNSFASRLLSKVLYLFKGDEDKGKPEELDRTICLDELQVPAMEDVQTQLPIKDLDSGEIHYIDLSQDHCFICGATSHSSRYCTNDASGALWVFPSSQ